MTAPFLAFNGIRANTASMLVPYAGRWVIDVTYDGDAVPSGPAVVTLGSLTLVGTVDPNNTSVFNARVVARVVAGAGGWPRTVPPRAYHDDLGVRRAEILAGLARDSGETIDFTGDATRLGVDFLRLADEPATTVLEAALRELPWRVDFDGVTRYGARPAAALGPDAELLDVADLGSKLLTFGCDDPASIPIGAVVTDARLGAPLVIRELSVLVESGKTRVTALGVDAITTHENRLLAALQRAARAEFPREQFLGPRKYRVVRMKPSASSSDMTRVELQIVKATTGIPDTLLVEVWPGTAGSSSELTPGALVLVDFIDGDREQPRISAMSTADDPFWRPVSMQVDATHEVAIGQRSSFITIGLTPSPAAARVTDDVDMGLWVATPGSGGISGVTWIPPGGGSPVTIPITPALPVQLTGKISSGSGKVSIE